MKSCILPERSQPPRLRLELGVQLDISSSRSFVHAAQMLRRMDVEQVVVDLARTRRVMDSGLGLLLMLKTHAGDRADRVLVVNCPPALVDRLKQAGLSGRVEMEGIAFAWTVGSAHGSGLSNPRGVNPSLRPAPTGSAPV